LTQNSPFAAVLAAATDAVLVTDADLTSPGPRIVFANAAFERLSGYPSAELLGRTPRLLQGQDTDPGVLTKLRAACGAGRPFHGTVTNYRADGTPFQMEWHVAPVRDASGRVAHFLSIHRNLSGRAGFDRTAELYIEQLIAESALQQASRLELAQANHRLAALATTDGLTGLANHRQFHDALAQALRQHTTVSLLMIDVDHFKSYNDEYGHPAGDHVLQVVADGLRATLRGGDTLARYGGEEFGLVLPGLDDDHALSVAERMRAAVERATLPGRTVTISIGAATFEAGAVAGGVDEAEPWLVDQADTALYAAKAQGRNRVRHVRHLSMSAIRPAPKLWATSAPTTAATGCDSPNHAACAGSPAGCLRCQSVPAGASTGAGTTGGALILGPQDADADVTLAVVLKEIDLPVSRLGPVYVIGNIGRRLGELATLFKDRLTPYTRACVRAAFAPAGATSAEQAIGALLFSEPLNKLVEHAEHEWVRTALADNWLFSVFHPILDVRTGGVFAQECLMRAKDPSDGKIFGAGQIIGACEALNLMHQLDQRARQTAIRAAAQHVPGTGKVFINFLPNTIYDPEICLRTTMEAAAEVGLPLGRLVFEVVETEDIPDMDRLRHILDYYRSRGVGTAVDDMGAGFTSIAYVEALRPDYVKLDRDLVVEAERSPEARQRLAEVVRASQGFGAKVIAEGMETVAQASMCADVGVDYMQGFLFAKPAVPPQAVRVAVPTASKRAAA
jgi:diguanylate cyclase (GGDEF)-like protein/PAS domain S-box-containing protein